ncbi:deoxynucleoside kinase [Mesoaciditoga lauensis]|uniref:deoxynucleoside kinase n=1 Tax=Mesoaciditoga lauensis TaxID=1495039 RepID=UPI0005613779|nr:deoxynucleoside kinase [Mesoaciditoga lauensis]
MIIGICGNIGAGKSTLIEILEREKNYTPVYEIVEENPYLSDFYKDMKKWAFHSQLFFLIKRFDFLKRVNASEGITLEDRTIDEDVEIFARNLHEMGYISQRDWQTYQSLFKTFSDHLPQPRGFIYLQASVSTLVKHVKRRGRNFENTISQEYLARLNELYGRWISRLKSPILKIDCDEYDFVESEQDRQKVVGKVAEFIERLEEF